MTYALRDYQWRDAELLRQGSSALWLEQRLGKTRTALHAFHESPAERLLVVCPTIAKDVWTTEATLEMGLPYPTEKLESLRPYPLRSPERCIAVINYEILAAWSNFLSGWAQVIVFDEIHRISNPNSATYKAAEQLSRGAMVWELTGTPWVNSSLDLYMQLRLLGPQRNPYYWWKASEFGDQFAYRKLNRYNYRGYDYRGLKNEEGLMQKLAGVAVRRLRREVPDFQESKIRFPVWLDEVHQPAPEGMGDLERQRAELSERKAELTITYLEEELRERPVVVFGWHSDYLARVARHFDVPVLDGSKSAARKDEIKTDFQTGRTDVLVANIKSAGTGIRLSRARHAVVGELHWSAVDLRQAEDRLVDERSHNTYHYLLTAGSCEERIWRTVLGKGAAMERLDAAALDVRQMFMKEEVA